MIKAGKIESITIGGRTFGMMGASDVSGRKLAREFAALGGSWGATIELRPVPRTQILAQLCRSDLREMLIARREFEQGPDTEGGAWGTVQSSARLDASWIALEHSVTAFTSHLCAKLPGVPVSAIGRRLLAALRRLGTRIDAELTNA